MKIRIILFVYLLLTANASAATWTVNDDGGAGVFTDIYLAVHAAADGDLIFVKPGTYSGFTLNKAVRIISEINSYPFIDSQVEITAIPAGWKAAVTGFRLRGGHPSCYIHDCDGKVHLDDISSTFDATVIENCAQVNITRSSLTGHIDYSTPYGARVKNATAIFSECNLTGRTGNGWSLNGSPGLLVENSVVHFMASSCRGGNGTCHIYYYMCGNGAYGIELHESQLYLYGTLDHKIYGGEGASWPPYSIGSDRSAIGCFDSTLVYSGINLIPAGSKPNIDYSNSSINMLSPRVPVVILEGTGQMGTEIKPKLFAAPGSAYALFYSMSPTLIPVAGLYTDLFINPASLRIPFVDVTPPQGYKGHPFYIPSKPHLPGKSFIWQAYVETPANGSYLSTAAAAVIVE